MHRTRALPWISYTGRHRRDDKTEGTQLNCFGPIRPLTRRWARQACGAGRQRFKLQQHKQPRQSPRSSHVTSQQLHCTLNIKIKNLWMSAKFCHKAGKVWKKAGTNDAPRWVTPFLHAGDDRLHTTTVSWKPCQFFSMASYVIGYHSKECVVMCNQNAAIAWNISILFVLTRTLSCTESIHRNCQTITATHVTPERSF